MVSLLCLVLPVLLLAHVQWSNEMPLRQALAHTEAGNLLADFWYIDQTIIPSNSTKNTHYVPPNFRRLYFFRIVDSFGNKLYPPVRDDLAQKFQFL